MFRRLMTHLLLLTIAGMFVLPLSWMLLTALKPVERVMQSPPDFLPKAWVASIHPYFERNSANQLVRIETPLSKRYPVAKLNRIDEPSYLVERIDLPFEMRAPILVPAVALSELSQTSEGKRHALYASSDSLEGTMRKLPVEIVFECRPGMWLVRQSLPDPRAALHAPATGVPVEYAWGVVSEEELTEEIHPVWENFPVALRKMNFMRMLGNTLWVTLLGTIGTTLVSALVAYGFAFGQFRSKALLFAITLATMMVPFAATMVPLYQVYRTLGWVGTFKPLWVICWFGSAFNIFLLRQFFLGLPKDLLHAARIDGCSELEIFWHVIVPLSRPALAMVAMFHFLHSWKDFLGPLLYLTDESQFTLSLGLHAFQSQHGGTPWNLLMAAGLVFSLPLIVLFFMTMKTFLRGIAMTGVKG